MNGSKWFLRSRMIWGVIFIGLSFYGVDVPEDMQARLPGLTAELFNQGVEFFGIVLALYGARKAENNLTVMPRPTLPWRKGL